MIWDVDLGVCNGVQGVWYQMFSLIHLSLYIQFKFSSFLLKLVQTSYGSENLDWNFFLFNNVSLNCSIFVVRVIGKLEVKTYV